MQPLLEEIAQLSAQQVVDSDTEVREVTKKLDAINQDVSDKQKELSVVEEAIVSHRKLLSGLKDEYSQQLTSNNNLAKEFSIMSSKLTAMKQEVNDIDSNQDKIRGDIATRTRALDEREAALRRRENKVAETERIVQNNAQLLNL